MGWELGSVIRVLKVKTQSSQPQQARLGHSSSMGQLNRQEEQREVIHSVWPHLEAVLRLLTPLSSEHRGEILGLNGEQEGTVTKQSWPILTPRLKAHYPSFHHPQRFLENFEFLSGHWINCLLAKGKGTGSSLESLLIPAREGIPHSAREHLSSISF